MLRELSRTLLHSGWKRRVARSGRGELPPETKATKSRQAGKTAHSLHGSARTRHHVSGSRKELLGTLRKLLGSRRHSNGSRHKVSGTEQKVSEERRKVLGWRCVSALLFVFLGSNERNMRTNPPNLAKTARRKEGTPVNIPATETNHGKSDKPVHN